MSGAQRESLLGQGSRARRLGRSAVEAEVSSDDPELARRLKDLFALHWARSHTMRIIWERILPTNLDHREREMLRDPDLESAFRDLTGLEPAGVGALEYVPARLRQLMEEHFGTGEFFSERVHANFDQARENLGHLNLELIYARRGEFLIGDTPALTVKRDHPGVGPLGGVPWMEADMAVLPLGPAHVVGFATKAAVIKCDESVADLVNSIQTNGAFRQVYFRPGSGLGDLVRQRLGRVQ